MAQLKTKDQAKDLLVLKDAPNGIDRIPAGTPLTRLNYYDGMFVRAMHLDAEQRYVRALAGFANQGLGPGIVHGFSAELESAGDTLVVRAGLAFDAEGRTLFLPRDVRVGVQDLIDKSRAASATGSVPGGIFAGGEFDDCTVVAAGGGTSSPVPEGNVYQIVMCQLEALCGQEDVYGRLCEKACATDVERPWRVEGVVLRALPLPLETPFPQSTTIALGDERFLRSNVAHSFFEDERRRHPHMISAAGLRSHGWCLGAGVSLRGCEVPLGVIARSGGKTLFLDPWIVRRERMDTPSRRYWQWRMWMRPWDVFLAQVLQFQCQLADGLGAVPPPEGDPCEVERKALGEGVQTLADVEAQIKQALPNGAPFLQGLTDLRAKFAELLKSEAGLGGAVARGARILLDRGFDELPPAGWLPVVSGQLVNGQVRALMGAGVDLRFCIVRPDFVGHALEEAQHLERISLTEGLDDATRRPQVDILVPNGTFVDAPQPTPQPQPEPQPAGTGRLTGRVRDASGAALPGVVVTARALISNASAQATTSRTGAYVFASLAAGTWQVSVSPAGGGTLTRPAPITAGATTTLDLTLGQPSVIADPALGLGGAPGVAVTTNLALVGGLRVERARPILANLDWVFFHRRREKQCGEPPAPPAPTKTRRYQVFHVANDFRVEDILRQFEDPATAAGFAARLTLVGPVEFTAGTSELVTPAATFLPLWQAAGPQNSVFSAVVATPGSAEDNLESARLENVLKLVAPVSSSAGAPTGRMDEVPAVLALAPDDGFMLLDTLQRTVERQIHEVFALPADALKRLQESVRQGANALDTALMVQARSLGTVQFDAGTANADVASLEAATLAWKNFSGNAAAFDGLNVSRASEPATSQTVHAQQGLFLAQKLGLTAAQIPHGAVTALSFASPTITLLAAAPTPSLARTARVVVYSRNDVPAGQPGRRRMPAVGAAAPDLLVRFERAGNAWTAIFDPPVLETLKALLAQLPNVRAYDSIQLVRPGVADAEMEERVKAAAAELRRGRLLAAGGAAIVGPTLPSESTILTEAGTTVGEILRIFDPLIPG